MTDIFTNGFTPLPDALIKNKRYGLVGAAIVGAVYRHTQMRRGVCDASLKTIAETVGVCERSCVRYLAKAVEDGYLKDDTPGLRHAPHTYRATKKINFVVALGMTQSPVGMTQSPVRYDSESLKDTIKETIKKPISAKPTRPPIVELHKRIANVYPPKALWESMETTVVDLERYERVLMEWLALGYRPNNFSGLMECYQRGQVATPRANGANRQPAKAQAGNGTNAELDAFYKNLGGAA